MTKNKNILSLTEKDSEKLISELNRLLNIQTKIKEYLNKHIKQLENSSYIFEGDLDLFSNSTSSSENIINSLDLASINFDENPNNQNNINDNLKLLLRLDDILKSLNINNEIKSKLEERTEGLLKLWRFEINKYNELFSKYESIRNSYDSLKNKSSNEKKNLKEEIEKLKNIIKSDYNKLKKDKTSIENDLRSKNKELNEQNSKLTKKIEKLISLLKKKKNQEDELLKSRKNNLINKIDNLSKNLNNFNNDTIANDTEKKR
eukprot:jgi/Orpsp1_1/1174902/evm.model.c7180000051887.2